MAEEETVGTTASTTRPKPRKKYSVEGKIRVVLSGLRGEASVTEVCRREGISKNLYYRWSNEFLEAGKMRLRGETVGSKASREVTELRRENHQLKQLLAELILKNRMQQIDIADP